jgi:hypothetical protein
MVAEATLWNDDAIEVRMNLAPLAGPSLALQILDAHGSPLLLPPPPVPGGEPSWATLSSGQSEGFRFTGFLPSWTAPGRYRVRLRYLYRPPSPQPGDWTGELVSDWAEFEVRT